MLVLVIMNIIVESHVQNSFYKEAGIHLLIDDHALIPLNDGDTLLVVGA